MNITLRDKEIYQILKDKFGEAEYQLLFVENEKGREKRSGIRLNQDGVAPASNAIMIGLSENEVLVPTAT